MSGGEGMLIDDPFIGVLIEDAFGNEEGLAKAKVLYSCQSTLRLGRSCALVVEMNVLPC